MAKEVKNKGGAPSQYSYELCKEICKEIADGKNIKQVLKSKSEYPSFQTWCNWKREHNELLDLYVKSIQDKADSVDADIDNTLDMLRSGEIEPSTANVIIQTLKWKASKYYPKMFGDKTDITTNGESVNKPMTIEWSVIDTEKKSKK